MFLFLCVCVSFGFPPTPISFHFGGFFFLGWFLFIYFFVALRDDKWCLDRRNRGERHFSHNTLKRKEMGRLTSNIFKIITKKKEPKIGSPTFPIRQNPTKIAEDSWKVSVDDGNTHTHTHTHTHTQNKRKTKINERDWSTGLMWRIS